jgi:drug/metabolite transporter (DMT)-like permease
MPAGSTTYLVPPLSILLGWIILGETPAALAVAGGALCLTGVVVASRKPKAAPIRNAAACVPQAQSTARPQLAHSGDDCRS